MEAIAADIADVYIWQTSTAIVLAVTNAGPANAGQPGTFDSDVLYYVSAASGAGSVELPFDRDFVTYVWFDALINYISFAGYRAKEGSNLPDFKKLWPCAAHVIGKDILVPAHGIYWLCMLHAMGFPDEQMPRLLVHGWWNIRGEKMSKSLGNVVDPAVLVEGG